MKVFIRWLLSVISLIVVAYVIKGFWFDSFTAILITALFLGIVNALIRPVALFFTLPINVLTLGLFTLIINALMFWLVYKLVPGFEISTFSTAVFAAIVYWLINWFLNLMFIDDTNQNERS